MIPFPGGAGFAPGSCVPINDTRWSIPDMGYHLDLPSAGQLVNGTDSTQVGVHRDVCSVFYIVTYRSDPNQQPAPTPPPTTPVATPGECDQTSPP